MPMGNLCLTGCCGAVGFDAKKWVKADFPFTPKKAADCFGDTVEIIEDVATTNISRLPELKLLFAGLSDICGTSIKFAEADWPKLKDWISTGGRLVLCAEWTARTGKITGATNASPCVITSIKHRLTNGQRVQITEVLGMLEINNPTSFSFITVIDDDHFSLNFSDSTGFGVYTSQGIWTLYDPITGVLGCVSDKAVLNQFLSFLACGLGYVGGDYVAYPTPVNIGTASLPFYDYCMPVIVGPAKISAGLTFSSLGSQRFGLISGGTPVFRVQYMLNSDLDILAFEHGTFPDTSKIIGTDSVMSVAALGAGFVFLTGDSDNWFGFFNALCKNEYCTFTQRLLDQEDDKVI